MAQWGVGIGPIRKNEHAPPLHIIVSTVALDVRAAANKGGK